MRQPHDPPDGMIDRFYIDSIAGGRHRLHDHVGRGKDGLRFREGGGRQIDPHHGMGRAAGGDKQDRIAGNRERQHGVAAIADLLPGNVGGAEARHGRRVEREIGLVAMSHLADRPGRARRDHNGGKVEGLERG